MVNVKLTRDQDNAGDTYEADAALYFIELWYRSMRDGSNANYQYSIG